MSKREIKSRIFITIAGMSPKFNYTNKLKTIWNFFNEKNFKERFLKELKCDIILYEQKEWIYNKNNAEILETYRKSNSKHSPDEKCNDQNF